MESLKFYLGPLCPTILRPVGGPPLQRLYGHFRGDPPTGRVACGRLLLPWTPHAERLCAGRPTPRASPPPFLSVRIFPCHSLKSVGQSRSCPLALLQATPTWQIGQARGGHPEGSYKHLDDELMIE
jgi:hypothetical protein